LFRAKIKKAEKGVHHNPPSAFYLDKYKELTNSNSKPYVVPQTLLHGANKIITPGNIFLSRNQ
jgi:hypothetical protein